ncbi:hypothetical protein T12_4187 [Trichinella patagoniensis]|uniref:Uncharacterized protein n=1 Tax=Trichinella patagoniensis TaxID=990121 RepID=A0A0V0Z8D5_9BILA|nr:hypothetical protein T12_4187 [Trichinella patagoniensis]
MTKYHPPDFVNMYCVSKAIECNETLAGFLVANTKCNKCTEDSSNQSANLQNLYFIRLMPNQTFAGIKSIS